MSGFISAGISAIPGVGAYTGGVGTLVLGGMLFTDFGLPERVTHGGQQQLTVHKLPGGARVIDNMGDDPAQITWSGIFLGPLAAVQRMQLEALRKAGKPLQLTWGDQSHRVMIADCQYDEEHVLRRIRYRITCTEAPIPPPESQATDDPGNGKTPDNQTDAKDTGQNQVTKARSNAAAAPTATRTAAVRADANAMMAGVDARQAMGTGTRELGAAP